MPCIACLPMAEAAVGGERRTKLSHFFFAKSRRSCAGFFLFVIAPNEILVRNEMTSRSRVIVNPAHKQKPELSPETTTATTKKENRIGRAEKPARSASYGTKKGRGAATTGFVACPAAPSAAAVPRTNRFAHKSSSKPQLESINLFRRTRLDSLLFRHCS